MPVTRARISPSPFAVGAKTTPPGGESNIFVTRSGGNPGAAPRRDRAPVDCTLAWTFAATGARLLLADAVATSSFAMAERRRFSKSAVHAATAWERTSESGLSFGGVVPLTLIT